MWFSREKEIGEVFYKIRRFADEYGRCFFVGEDSSKHSGFYSVKQTPLLRKDKFMINSL